ncbi:unnamed protein product [Lactuca virosa]|uniref:Uncharacterized protein n=1 Tax=Lactuca virosa TaxID=75947 RepID=A0AAU9N5A5_9ASTR|nr:unnamed protein product [Lactuca virosa]
MGSLMSGLTVGVSFVQRDYWAQVAGTVGLCGGVWKTTSCSPAIWLSVGVWKTTGCPPAIWFSGGGCEKVDVALTSSTIGGVVLLDITVNWGICIGVLCADTAAEEVFPPMAGCCGSLVGAKTTGCSHAIWLSDGVWNTTGYLHAIWFSVGGCEKVGVVLTFSTVGNVVLLDITVNLGVCIGVLCVHTAAEEVCPRTSSSCGEVVGAVISAAAEDQKIRRRSMSHHLAPSRIRASSKSLSWFQARSCLDLFRFVVLQLRFFSDLFISSTTWFRSVWLWPRSVQIRLDLAKIFSDLLNHRLDLKIYSIFSSDL